MVRREHRSVRSDKAGETAIGTARPGAPRSGEAGEAGNGWVWSETGLAWQAWKVREGKGRE